MKIFLTSIGERTTNIVMEELMRLGFEVIVLCEKQSWWDKYVEFIHLAERFNEPVIHLDADMVPNKNLWELTKFPNEDTVQGHLFDFYRNDLWAGGVLYSPKAIKIIKANLNKLDRNRPESSACRLSQLKPVKTLDVVIGSHGFFQDRETMERAKKHKEDRGQIGKFNFELAFKLSEL